ncbi:MAG: beta strand repeat-containing protein [Candidatus Marisimplicoccus sp.]
MKKGLLTLLAASLVFVGCQNYDDQFDDLNAQISALKSQVDGLSALSGQVSALSGSISGLQSGIAASASSAQMTALSASLASLQAEVDAIEAAIATTATAAEVTALQTSLTAVEADLADLLVSNNVYSAAISITDAASMASALALGNKVALMNNTVSITDAATVADADIQTFVNRIKTMNGAFTYDSGSATGFTPTFNEMVSAKAITLTTAGDISFNSLASATTIRINDDYETKITSVDFGALTSLTDFTDDATAKKINLTSATNIDLASLTRLTSTSADPFEITMKEGGTLDISALDDVSTAGAQEDLYLDIDGAASVTMSNIYDGDLGFTNVATVSVSNFIGTIDIDAGVNTLTVVDGVNVDMAGSSDLTTATLDFAYDSDTALTTAQAAIAAAGYSSTYTEDLDDGTIDFTDLESLTITGKLMDLYVDGTDLQTLSIDATMHDLTITGATDLTTLTVASGSSIGNISLTGTTNLAVADFNHTSNLTDTDSSAQKSVTMSVTSNTGLTKLHSTGDDVDTLTITGNTALAELDFTGLADDGAETTPTPAVTIWGNALVAVSAANTSDGETDRADGLATDLGSFDDGTSGMDTLKTYLTHMAATAGTTAFVTFDTLQTETDTETTGTTSTTLNVADAGDGSTTNEATVLKMSPAVAAVSNATPATQGKEAFAFTTLGTLQFAVNGVNIPASPLALTGNSAVDAANLATTANLNLATAAGVTMTAADTYGSYIEVLLIDYANNYSGSPTGERYTAAQLTAAVTDTGDVFETGHSDEFTLTITDTSGVTNTVTASLGGQSVTGSAIADIEEAIVKAWEAKYGAAGTASWTAIATMLDTGTGTLDIRMLQEDSGGNGAAVSFSVADKAQVSGLATQTSANIDYKIGATLSTSDNTTKSTDTSNAGLIVTFESSLSGVTDTVLTGITSEVANTSAVLASSTDIRTSYSTATGITSYAATGYPRTDVRNVEAAVASTATGTAQTLFNRVAWLG